MTEKQKLVLSKAIYKFGTKNQIDMVTEEIGELLQAINKVRRLDGITYSGIIHPEKTKHIKYSLAYFNLCSEVADMKIMLAQIELMLDSEAIQISIDRKIERLSNKINK